MSENFSWRLYYADGSTFDSSDGRWEDAPSSGVQALMLYFKPPYRQFITGIDEYTISDKKQVKYGTLMEPEEAYEEIRDRAFEDYEWPDR